MKRFGIDIPNSEIAALHARLDAARWPDQIGDPWVYGTDITYLKALCRYWRHEFDWRAQEASLNRFDQFKTTFDEHELHFIHQRSTHADAQPLLITHGWPGSISEFVKIIAPLTQPEQFGGDPRDAFHVICPSIPGFGFSKAPTRPGFQPRACAELFMQLMERLGYAQYFAQGGDVGSAVTTWLGALATKQLKGIHLNLVFTRPPKDNAMAGVSAIEQQLLAERQAHMANEIGYQHIQGTKPQTLGYALNDSPIGLAAWITEKFHKWTQHRGNVEEAISKDEMLTDISIYWFTQSITSSVRMYYESRRYDGKPFPERVDVPTAVANFPGELYLPPRAWVEKQYNVVHWSQPSRGGHFAAIEAPELLVADIRDAFRPLRG